MDMKTIHTLTVGMVLAGFLVSCQTNTRRNNLILIDNSKTISEKEWDRYIDVLANTIVYNMKPGDRLTIQFIDECVLTRTERELGGAHV